MFDCQVISLQDFDHDGYDEAARELEQRRAKLLLTR
jgi:hypothetical protein